jgi:GT2 family glycosyltransferase
VVVIASACTDATEDLVRAMADREPRVQLLSQSTREGKASAINLFINTTSEPLCALVGGDTLLAPGALAALVAPFADQCVGMTGARVVPTNLRRGVAARLVHVLWDLHHEAAMRRPKLGEAVAFRRGVDHIDATSLTDEVSLEAAVLATGRTLRYVPEAVVFNHGAESVHDYLTHRRRIHRGHLGVQHTTGYSPSTLDRTVVLGATLAVLRRRPLSALALAAAAVLEGVARSQAWRAHRLALDADNGLWEPIHSAKRPFEIEYEPVEVVGYLSRSAAEAPAPDQGRILSGTSG